jgi:surface polysaccharide O-acyltransferase-like enzyme
MAAGVEYEPLAMRRRRSASALVSEVATVPAAAGKRWTSIETLRVAAVFAVVWAHVRPLTSGGVPPTAYPAAAILLHQACRWVVPFFFFVSGFLLAQRTRQDASIVAAAWRTTRRLLIVFASWSAVYFVWQLVAPDRVLGLYSLPEPPVSGPLSHLPARWARVLAPLVTSPIDYLAEGSRVHLWFLPALAIGLMITGVAADRRRLRWAVLFGLGLYVVGLGCGSYAPLTGWQFGINPRNGPFASVLPASLGFAIGRSGWRPKLREALLLAAGGYALLVTESLWLWITFGSDPTRHNFLIGTIPFGLGMAALALARPNLGSALPAWRLGSATLGVYASHLLVIDLLVTLGAGCRSIPEVVVPPIVYGLTLGATAILSRLPFARALVGGH